MTGAERAGSRPERVFGTDTTRELWTDPHLSAQMLRAHLDDSTSAASRPTGTVRRSVEWLVERFGIGPRTSVLDLGCGPGGYTNPLARTGARVVGIDFSERSLRHAAAVADREGIRPAYVCGDYLDLPLSAASRFDLVLMIWWDLAVLAPDRRRALLGRVAGLLADGGRFVFDVPTVATLRLREETVEQGPNLMGGFWSAQPYHGVHHTFVYEEERVTLDRYEIVERDRTRTFSSWLQHFNVDALRAELAVAGLGIASLHGDVTGAPVPDGAEQLCVVAVPIPSVGAGAG